MNDKAKSISFVGVKRVHACLHVYILGRQGLEPLHVTVVTGNHLPSALGHYF
jgi:hypothetical protein